MTDIEIAEGTKLKNIKYVAKNLGLKPRNLYMYGENIAKITSLKKRQKQGKLILVTAINPTPLGEGKTTISIGLADGLKQQKKRVCLALREPSLGPVFGIKGGGTGGGHSQIMPMAEINLHFTGDFHAVTSANNLLSSIIDNHIFQGNELYLDVNNIFFKRCIDLNDRALRRITIKNEKCGREDEFTITSASETMAIMCIAENIADLKTRLGNILVGLNRKGKPIFAKDLKAEEAMAVLLRNSLCPNLVQTLEGTPAIVHFGPFANIAHGCNSVKATRTALSLADYVVTEAGFGADLGAEKFLDFKCRISGLKPDVVVIVATIKALKAHSGVLKEDILKEDVEAVLKGTGNLKKHISNIKNVFKLPCVIALNRFSSDYESEITALCEFARNINVKIAVNNSWAEGGKGALALASAIIEVCKENNSKFEFAYELNADISQKIKILAKKIYGASNVRFSDSAKAKIKQIKKWGYSNLPIIIAKTQYSLSDNPNLLNVPKNFIMTVSDIELKSGAEFIVVIMGNTMLMPGLSREPAAYKIKLSPNGKISGLF